jgi:L-lysine 6-transaminase
LARDFPDLIRNIRGMGLYQGFTMVRASDKARLIELALDCEDMVLLGAGYDSIRLRPSLSVTLGDIEVFGERLGSALARLRHR